jgi:hypothetical protein
VERSNGRGASVGNIIGVSTGGLQECVNNAGTMKLG